MCTAVHCVNLFANMLTNKCIWSENLKEMQQEELYTVYSSPILDYCAYYIQGKDPQAIGELMSSGLLASHTQNQLGCPIQDTDQATGNLMSAGLLTSYKFTAGLLASYTIHIQLTRLLYFGYCPVSMQSAGLLSFPTYYQIECPILGTVQSEGLASTFQVQPPRVS